MASKYQVIGPSSRKKMKKTSPFATLILDVTSALTEEDVSKLKLALQLDKLAKRNKLSKMKHAADVLSYLELDGHLSKYDTGFLEQLLVKIGRKDLERLIIKYNNRQKLQSDRQHVPDKEQTSPKWIDHHDDGPANFTQLRRHSPHGENNDIFPSLLQSHTEVKVPPNFCPSMFGAQTVRPSPEGTSMVSSSVLCGNTRRPLQSVQTSSTDSVPKSSNAQITSELTKSGHKSPGSSLNVSPANSPFPNMLRHSMSLGPSVPMQTLGLPNNGHHVNLAFSTASASMDGSQAQVGLSGAGVVATSNSASPASSSQKSTSSQMSVDMASQRSSSQMSVCDDEKLAVYMDKVWPHESDDANINWIETE